MQSKRLIIFATAIITFVGGVSFMMPTAKSGTADKPIVSVSTYTLYEVADAVAGETLDVRPIIPPGSDAHMFSPNPAQVADIARSSLFIYNGAGFEMWAESLKNTLPETTNVIDMSEHVRLLKAEEETPSTHADEHDHGSYDPHYWLDIDNMIAMTHTVESEFSRLFPKNSERYHAAAQDYIERLKKLKSDYAAGLKECQSRTLVSNHDAFGYLAHSNKLENVSVIGLSSDEQPSAKNIADIITAVKEHGVKTIFFEEMINDNVSQTIAHETGTKVQSLQPLENISEDELKSHQTYLTIMRENLKKLQDAMECR